MPPRQRLGILGGSFNPPHLGHLAVATHALSQLGLDAVALVPSHTPPHKPALEDPGPLHRLEMCRLAVEGHAGLRACALEVERGGVSYTVDTLRSLHVRHPHVQPTLILGSDMARTLPTWRRPEELLRLAHLAVAERPEDGRRDVLHALAALDPPATPGAPATGVAPAASVAFLDMPPIDISSSLVRERVAHGESVDDLVGKIVATYISRHRLYRTPARTGAL